ncbi:MAG: ATP-NAD kinase family protein [Gammaproteobacteria bacterium]|nr:ATP-NAD kinase family protein [Gammaproteobacteria bacterium]MBQ0774306.1 ATP-NAD kinase family protein [Gammaproteobacteria bacterium]
MTLRLGLIVNPLAGLGGSVGLKGSDGAEIVAEAHRRGAVGQAVGRAARALSMLTGGHSVEVLTWAGDMGEQSCIDAGIPCAVVGRGAQPSSPNDTAIAARALLDQGIDLLVFAGGDGTARDVCDAIGERLTVLGIPAGCKMHSAVYAVNPEAAGRLLVELTEGALVNVAEADVRDIDEDAFRLGIVRARHYGTLKVPLSSRFIQQIKCGAREQEDLQVTEIAAWVAELMKPGVTYAMGSGSTAAELMEQLGLDNTLLGVDLVRDGEVIAADVSATQMLDALTGVDAKAVLTVIGGQGHLFGRGNQQFSPAVIRLLGKENLIVLASRLKLATLEGRPLLVDSGDAQLDKSLCGLLPILCGYEDEVLYRVACDAGGTSID